MTVAGSFCFLEAYVATERKIGHRFTLKLSIAEVAAAVAQA